MRHYAIYLKSQVDIAWQDWFESVQIAAQDENTFLAATLPDQSALMGLLLNLHNLGLEIISVAWQEAEISPARLHPAG